MLFSIPTSPDTPFYKQFTSFDGVNYLLTFTYNQRENIFYLTIGDEASNDIKRGLKLVTNWPLFVGHVDERLPRGTLMVISNTTDKSSPGIGELGAGRRCELIYDDGEE